MKGTGVIMKIDLDLTINNGNDKQIIVLASNISQEQNKIMEELDDRF